VHFGFAAEPLDIGQKVALVGADGAAEGVVVGEGGAESSGVCSETTIARSPAGKRKV